MSAPQSTPTPPVQQAASVNIVQLVTSLLPSPYAEIKAEDMNDYTLDVKNVSLTSGPSRYRIPYMYGTVHVDCFGWQPSWGAWRDWTDGVTEFESLVRDGIACEDPDPLLELEVGEWAFAYFAEGLPYGEGPPCINPEQGAFCDPDRAEEIEEAERAYKATNSKKRRRQILDELSVSVSLPMTDLNLPHKGAF
ncbi:MAG: hypothetical protein AB7I45_01475 [Planctomycetota bacterium]